MHLTTRIPWHRSLCIAWMTIILALAIGCKEAPKDKLREGRAALAAQNADLAETRLSEALKADPSMVEARRLMVDVHLLRDDHAKAEEALFALWKDLGFDQDAAQIAVQDRPHRQLMSEQFNELYRRWAEKIDVKEQPEKFEEVAQKGLERNPRSTRLNTLLVDFYKERAEKMLERGEKLKAAEELEKVIAMRTLSTIRQEATQRAANLRKEAFHEAAIARFEADIKPGLVAAGRYDTERDAVLIVVDQEIDRRLMPGKEQDHAQARQLASRTLGPEIGRVVIQVGGFPEGADLSKLGSPEVGIVSEDFVRAKFTLVAAVPVASVLELAYRFHEEARKAAVEKSGAGAKDAAEPAQDDGAEPGEEPVVGEAGEQPAGE
ncbi:MAG: hypothetical protein H0U74_01525 [Bradymonadaceae bacterium]|nr:hypothetical protein [Lujinxingiaceae bacterium]